MQDRATPQTAGDFLDNLHQTYNENMISKRISTRFECGQNCLPKQTDLTWQFIYLGIYKGKQFPQNVLKHWWSCESFVRRG